MDFLEQGGKTDVLRVRKCGEPAGHEETVFINERHNVCNRTDGDKIYVATAHLFGGLVKHRVLVLAFQGTQQLEHDAYSGERSKGVL